MQSGSLARMALVLALMGISAAAAAEASQAQENVTIVRGSVKSGPVTLIASADNVHLRELIAADCAAVTGGVQTPDWVRVYSDDVAFSGGSRVPFPGERPGDLVVFLGWAAPLRDPGEMARKLSAHLVEQWYCAAAWQVAVSGVTDQSAVLPPRAASVLALGIRLAAIDVALPYLRTELGLSRTVFSVADAELGTAVARVCLAVDVSVTGVGVTGRRREWISLPGNLSRTVVSFQRLSGTGVASIDGIIRVDATDLIRETDEEDNSATFHWEQPPVPDWRWDLYPEETGLRQRTVSCIPSADNPVLLEVVRRTGVACLASVPGFQTVQVLPLHRDVPAIERLIEVDAFTPGFDLLVVGVCAPESAAAGCAGERLAKTFSQQWYVAEVCPVSLGPLGAVVLGDASDGMVSRACCGTAVLIRLAGDTIGRVYWRISVPVICRSVESGPVDLERPRLGFAAMGVPLQNALFAGHEEGAVPWGAARLVCVAFKGAFAGSDGRVASVAVRDHVWLIPGEHALAVGFLEQLGKPLEGAVSVDPDNAIAEFDEGNNTVPVVFRPLAPMPGQFSARAFPEAAADGGRLLVVEGTLKNTGDTLLTVPFTSGLQMDFQFGASYRWSDGKAFTMALTRVDIRAGESHTWRLRTPMKDLRWDGRPTSIQVWLTGNAYRARVPYPAPETPAVPDKPMPLEEGVHGEPIDIIVPPSGVNLEYLPEWVRLMGDGPMLDKEPEGNLQRSTMGLMYRALAGFVGSDYLVMSAAADEQRATALLCRLHVGLQCFRLSLRRGWNLVSLPIRPAEGVQSLLASLPRGFAWTWNGTAYEPAAEVPVGRGLWLFSLEDQELEFMGEPVPAAALVLQPGWNLVGTINSADYSRIEGISSVFGAVDDHVVPRSTLRSGEALWVYADTETVLPLN